jgi:hypothetical protein
MSPAVTQSLLAWQMSSPAKRMVFNTGRELHEQSPQTEYPGFDSSKIFVAPFTLNL